MREWFGMQPHAWLSLQLNRMLSETDDALFGTCCGLEWCRCFGGGEDNMALRLVDIRWRLLMLARLECKLISLENAASTILAEYPMETFFPRERVITKFLLNKEPHNCP